MTQRTYRLRSGRQMLSDRIYSNSAVTLATTIEMATVYPALTIKLFATKTRRGTHTAGGYGEFARRHSPLWWLLLPDALLDDNVLVGVDASRLTVASRLVTVGSFIVIVVRTFSLLLLAKKGSIGDGYSNGDQGEHGEGSEGRRHGESSEKDDAGVHTESVCRGGRIWQICVRVLRLKSKRCLYLRCKR